MLRSLKVKRTMPKFDIDIDVNKKVDRRDYGKPVPIVNYEKQKILPHPSGIVLDDIPVDPDSGMVPFDYKILDDMKLTKVDLLTNHSYDVFHKKEDILNLVDKIDTIDWDWFQDNDFTEKLPHLKGNSHYLNFLHPKSVEELADVLALIRPGKIHLMDEYLVKRRAMDNRIYSRPTNDKMYMKKSHAIAYAVMICVAALKQKKRLSPIEF